MNVLVIDPLNHPAWDELLLTAKGATFFQTEAWARVLAEAYRYQPCYFAVMADGQLTGLIPLMGIHSFFTGKRGVSLPFTDTCRPIVGSRDIFQALMRRISQYGSRAGWKYVEFRGGGEWLDDAPPCAQHSTHLLRFGEGEAELKKRFRESTRRNIRHAERAGVEVTLENNREALAAFYRLHCLTRRHHGLPPQPWSFFAKIQEHIIARRKGFVALGVHRGRPVAGAIYFYFRDRALYKFGASDRRHHRLRANYLVMWEAIRWLIRNGFRSLHFGRTELENHGLFQFKKGWRAAEGKVAYYRMDLKKNVFASGGGVPASWAVCKFLPIAVLKWAGSILYRHVG